MKRLMVVVLGIILLLCLSGCTLLDLFKPETRVNGQIRDQNSNGIPGVKVKLGSFRATTDEGGNFIFPKVTYGSYKLSGEGGTSGRYIVPETDVSISRGSISCWINPVTAYRMMGCGVVIQGGTDAKFSSASLKQITLERGSGASVVQSVSNPGLSRSKETRCSFLYDNVCFILLDWEQLNNSNGNYYIYYLTEGESGVQVWSSVGDHPEDPPFDPDQPKAYLDLTQELKWKVSEPGQYRFRITTDLNFNAGTFFLPDITVSLGQIMANYPTNLAYTVDQLSWLGVTRASGYRVRIYNEALTSKLYDSGNTLLDATALDIPAGLTAGTYYALRVDAQALDDTGWPLEMTRGTSGFVR